MTAFSSRVEAFSVSHAQILTEGQTFLQALAQASIVGEDVFGVHEAGLSPDTGDFQNEGDDGIMSTWNWINKADLTVKAGYLSMPLLSAMTGRPVDTIAAVTAASEVQTLTTNGATAGTYKLSFRGQQTGTIAWNANAAAIQTALQALSTVGTGNATVSGGPLSTADVVVTFAGSLANEALPLIVVDITAATGATTSAVTETTPGKAATKAGFGFDLWHEDAIVTAPRPMIIKMPSKDEYGAPADFVIGLYKVQFKPFTFDGPTYRDGLKVNYDGTALQSSYDEQGNVFSDGKKRFGRLLAIQR